MEEEYEERRKAFAEGGRRGSALEVIAGVVSPTFEGMGLNKVCIIYCFYFHCDVPVTKFLCRNIILLFVILVLLLL